MTPGTRSPEPFETLKLAASGYSKFSDEGVQADFFRLLHTVADDVESRAYEPSDTTDEFTVSLVDAMNTADEESASKADNDLGEDED